MVASAYSRRPLHVRVDRPVSTVAGMAGRAAVFAAVLLALIVLTRRLGLISYSELFLPLLAAGAITLGALVMSVLGLADSWARGAKGGWRSLRAFTLAVLVAIPFGVLIERYATNPAVRDVTTDPRDPPRLASLGGDDVSGVATLPEFSTRRYDATLERVTVGLDAAITELGWPLSGGEVEPVPEASSAPASVAEGGVPLPITRAPTDEQLAIIESLRAAEREARRRENGITVLLEGSLESPILKLPTDIAVRMRDNGAFTTVDIRSRSREGRHDFGENARRIRAFLEELDAAMVREGVR